MNIRTYLAKNKYRKMNKHKHLVIFAIILLGMFFVWSSAAQAATATFDVTGDTFINEAYPDNNYGSAGSIVVSSQPIDRIGFLQFEEISLPEGAIVDSTKFKFYIYDHDYDDDGWARIGLIGGSEWEETEPTWGGTYPGALMSSGDFVEVNLNLSTGWKEVDITEPANKWFSEERNQRGLYVYPAGSDDFAFSFRSKDHGSDYSAIEVEYHVEEEEYAFELVSPEDEDTITVKRPTFEWTEIDEGSNVDDYLLIINKIIDDGDDTEEVVDEKISDDDTEYTLEKDLEDGEYRWYMEALRNDETLIHRTESWEFTVELSEEEEENNEDEEEEGVDSGTVEEEDVTSFGAFTSSQTLQQGDESQEDALKEEEKKEEKRNLLSWDNFFFLVLGAAIVGLAYILIQEYRDKKKEIEGKAKKEMIASEEKTGEEKAKNEDKKTEKNIEEEKGGKYYFE